MAKHIMPLYRDERNESSLIQGPCCGSEEFNQLHTRTSSKNGHIAVGYGPIPENKFPEAELYVDGLVHVATLERKK